LVAFCLRFHCSRSGVVVDMVAAEAGCTAVEAATPVFRAEAFGAVEHFEVAALSVAEAFEADFAA
jgi:hypothetical protein